MSGFIKRVIINFLSAGKGYSKTDIDLSKIIFLNSVAVIGIILFLSYAVINLYIQDYFPAILEIVLAIGLLAAILILRYGNNLMLAINLGSIVAIVISWHNFWTGGFEGSGMLWVYMLPPVIFLVQGYKRGLYWVGTFFMVLSGTVVLQFIDYVEMPYDIFISWMFLITFAVVSLLTIVYQLLHERSQRLIAEQAKDLKEVNKKLKKEVSEHDKFSKETEDKSVSLEKLNRAMTGRELKMIELKKEIKKLKEKR